MKKQCSSSLAKLLWFVALRYLPSALSYKWRGQFAGSDFLQLPFRCDGYDGFLPAFHWLQLSFRIAAHRSLRR